MKKRFKTYFKTSMETCHKWASQSQPEGRSSNVFFEGKSIFSYGRHLEMARFITEDIVFVNSNSFSVTINWYIHQVKLAVCNRQVFQVPSMTNHNGNCIFLLNQMRLCETKTKSTNLQSDIFHSYLRSTEYDLTKYLSNFEKFLSKEIKAHVRKEIKTVHGTDYKPFLEKCKVRHYEKESIKENQNRQ